MDRQAQSCILSLMLTEEKAEDLEQLQFLTPDTVHKIAAEFGSPVYVYDEATLIQRADLALGFRAPFGLTVRYAMKANPLAAILRVFDARGVHIDASSGYE